MTRDQPAPPSNSSAHILSAAIAVALAAGLLALQIKFENSVDFWPFLLAAPIVTSLLRGPLWGCVAAVLTAAGQPLLTRFAGGPVTPLSVAAPTMGATAITGMILALGSHAVRRRHRAQREVAETSSAQLRLATVTGDPSSLHTLLGAAARSIPDLIGRASCAILLLEQGRGRFAVEQVSTAPSEKGIPGDLSVEPDRLPSLKKAVESRAPVVVEREEIEASPYAGALDFPSIAIVPLVNWGHVLGCLMIAGGVRRGKGRYVPEPFAPKDLETAFGLAGQVAVAVQNARLYDEILMQKELLDTERQKSDELLLNILPGPIADRLKATQATIADSFVEVTVMFADIVDFTPLSSTLPAAELVSMLNGVFTAFDELAEKHQLEKIKTIGDAYMAVGGLPTPRERHAQAVADMALEMQDVISRFLRKAGEPLRLRIGINTGPVVAGVIGTRKFIYDLWGDTVNLASRMESQGVAGGIQVTPAAYEKLKAEYEFEQRGPIEVKGKGQMDVYVLKGRK